MRKFIGSILISLLLPVILSVPVVFFSPKLQFGMEYGSVENHLMGKKILLEINGLYKDMDVEEYVVGVLAGVSPAEYNIEALKVTAIMIRTNLLKEMEEKRTSDATDLSYHYLTIEEREDLWGEKNFKKNEAAMERAVIETAGQVIYYQDELIMALYHEVSFGKTISAKEALEEEIPYLQSVESGCDVEAKDYMNIVEYTKDDIKTIVTEGNLLEEPVEDEIEITIEESTSNGYVKKVKVNNLSFSGEEIMNLFGLPSLIYYIEPIGENVRFVCLGKGNCMGVSLYGANNMAWKGKLASDIIVYYYKDVRIEKYN